MRNSSLAISPVSGATQRFDSGVQTKTLYKQQLANRLKGLANQEYQLMLKLNLLANTLKRPSFNEIIDCCEVFSDALMATINHYTLHIREIENSNINIASIVQPCEIMNYSGWVDRAKEIVRLHIELKEQIVNIFISFSETDFPDTFHFLRQQLALHEDQLWCIRQQIEK